MGAVMEYFGERNDEIIAFVRHESVENVAVYLLLQLGFKANLLGTTYLQEAIVQKYATNTNSLCKHLYPLVAAKYNATGERVERSIRHTINECHASGRLSCANEVLGWQMVGNYPPTNSEFISAICTWIHLKKSCAHSPRH